MLSCLMTIKRGQPASAGSPTHSTYLITRSSRSKELYGVRLQDHPPFVETPGIHPWNDAQVGRGESSAERTLVGSGLQVRMKNEGQLQLFLFLSRSISLSLSPGR